MNSCYQLLLWYESIKRDLPWRKTDDAYRIWLSEIMLQQTRVETVKEYYRHFLELFPTVRDLAQSTEEQVLKAWEGLGYYSRAKNLHNTAKIITGIYQGEFPRNYEELLALPGIGAYTAGAIASFAFSMPYPAIDGNVNRVATRFFGIHEDITYPATRKKIYNSIMDFMPKEQPGCFNQAMIELGATLCKPIKPCCNLCPLHVDCVACQDGNAELLPVHEKKASPKYIEMGVSLLEWDGKILVMKRKEKMLGGLYVFYLTEDHTNPDTIREILFEAGLQTQFIESLGKAKHVFTHRVWEMDILHFCFTVKPSSEWLLAHDALLADSQMLQELPLPTAVRTAKEAALKLLNQNT